MLSLLKRQPWTRFRDMCKGGSPITQYDYIYVQAARVNACRVLLEILGTNPPLQFNFFIKEGKSLTKLSRLERHPEPGCHITLSEFREQNNVLVVDAREIISLEVMDS